MTDDDAIAKVHFGLSLLERAADHARSFDIYSSTNAILARNGDGVSRVLETATP